MQTKKPKKNIAELRVQELPKRLIEELQTIETSFHEAYAGVEHDTLELVRTWAPIWPSRMLKKILSEDS